MGGARPPYPCKTPSLSLLGNNDNNDSNTNSNNDNDNCYDNNILIDTNSNNDDGEWGSTFSEIPSKTPTKTPNITARDVKFCSRILSNTPTACPSNDISRHPTGLLTRPGRVT